jgi:hypothetical protein
MGATAGTNSACFHLFHGGSQPVTGDHPAAIPGKTWPAILGREYLDRRVVQGERCDKPGSMIVIPPKGGDHRGMNTRPTGDADNSRDRLIAEIERQ